MKEKEEKGPTQKNPGGMEKAKQQPHRVGRKRADQETTLGSGKLLPVAGWAGPREEETPGYHKRWGARLASARADTIRRESREKASSNIREAEMTPRPATDEMILRLQVEVTGRPKNCWRREAGL